MAKINEIITQIVKICIQLKVPSFNSLIQNDEKETYSIVITHIHPITLCLVVPLIENKLIEPMITATTAKKI